MRGLNKAMVIGFLGADPVVKSSGEGKTVVSVSLATSEVWTDGTTGDKKEATEWHRITFFGKAAEIIAQHCHKGDALYVEGKLKTSRYLKDGQEHFSTSIHAENFDFISTKGGSQGQQTGSNQADNQNPQSGQVTTTPVAQVTPRSLEANHTPPSTGGDDDIPM